MHDQIPYPLRSNGPFEHGLHCLFNICLTWHPTEGTLGLGCLTESFGLDSAAVFCMSNLY